MKKIIFLLLLIVSLIGHAQTPANDTTRYAPVFGYGYDWSRGKFDSTIIIPKGDTVTNPLGSPHDKGRLLFRLADSLVYVNDGVKWKALGSVPASAITLTGDASGTGTSAITVSVNKLNGQLASYYLNYNNLTNQPAIPTQFNPIAGSNVTLSGTYPNITFNASGGGGGSSQASLRWFNIYDLQPTIDSTFNNDATPFIQAAIDTVYAHGGGTLFIPRGHYKIAGALITSIPGSGNNCNCQIYMPAPQAVSDTGTAVTIMGDGLQSQTVTIGTNVCPQSATHGTVLESTIVGSGTTPSVIGTDWGYIALSGNTNLSDADISNLTVKVRSKTGSGTDTVNTMTGFNFGLVGAVNFNNVIVSVTSVGYNIVQPASGTSGIILPGLNNAASSNMTNVIISGFYNGVIVSEHANIDKLLVNACFNGINFTTMYHAAYIHRIGVNGCVNGINVTSVAGCNFLIDEFDTEHFEGGGGTGNKWFAYACDINKSSSAAAVRATINSYHVVISFLGIADYDWHTIGLVASDTVNAIPLGYNITQYSNTWTSDQTLSAVTSNIFSPGVYFKSYSGSGGVFKTFDNSFGNYGAGEQLTNKMIVASMTADGATAHSQGLVLATDFDTNLNGIDSIFFQPGGYANPQQLIVPPYGTGSNKIYTPSGFQSAGNLIIQNSTNGTPVCDSIINTSSYGSSGTFFNNTVDGTSAWMGLYGSNYPIPFFRKRFILVPYTSLNSFDIYADGSVPTGSTVPFRLFVGGYSGTQVMQADITNNLQFMVNTTTTGSATINSTGTIPLAINGSGSGGIQMTLNAIGVSNQSAIYFQESGISGFGLIHDFSNNGTNNFALYDHATTVAPIMITNSDVILLGNAGTSPQVSITGTFVQIASLNSNGTVYSNGGTLSNINPSDRHLKHAIKPLQYGLNAVLHLRAKQFYYNSDSTNSRLKYGFIAQDVEQIIPEIVHPLSIDSELLGIDSDNLTAVLIKAVQELSAKVDAQANEINTLKKQVKN